MEPINLATRFGAEEKDAKSPGIKGLSVRSFAKAGNSTPARPGKLARAAFIAMILGAGVMLRASSRAMAAPAE